MEKNKRGILIGMVIGDGYIRDESRCNTASLKMCHCQKQKPYIEYKAVLLHSILGGCKPRVTEFNNNGYPGVRTQKTNKYFRILRKWIYANGKKEITPKILNWLTPQGIAIWYMDDGCLGKKRRNGKIHAYDIYINCHTTLQNAEVICSYFKERWGLCFVPNKNHSLYRIRGGTYIAREFIRLFGKHIIPAMKYKIDMGQNRTSTLTEKSVRDSLSTLVTA